MPLQTDNKGDVISTSKVVVLGLCRQAHVGMGAVSTAGDF